MGTTVPSRLRVLLPLCLERCWRVDVNGDSLAQGRARVSGWRTLDGVVVAVGFAWVSSSTLWREGAKSPERSGVAIEEIDEVRIKVQAIRCSGGVLPLRRSAARQVCRRLPLPRRKSEPVSYERANPLTRVRLAPELELRRCCGSVRSF